MEIEFTIHASEMQEEREISEASFCRPDDLREALPKRDERRGKWRTNTED